MGSRLGKSTAAPTGMASTCGSKCLSFCFMVRARRTAAVSTGARPSAGSSHTTTPLKSLWRRTPGSRELVSVTVPLANAQYAGSTHRQLKQIRQSQVIVVVEPEPIINIRRARLRGFQAQQHIGREPIVEIRAVDPVARDLVRQQVGGASVLQSGEDVERQPLGRQERQL